MADVMGKNVVYTKVEEASALGAVAIASVSMKIHKSLGEAAKKMVSSRGRHAPNQNNHEIYLRKLDLFKSLYESNKKHYEKLRNP